MWKSLPCVISINFQYQNSRQLRSLCYARGGIKTSQWLSVNFGLARSAKHAIRLKCPPQYLHLGDITPAPLPAQCSRMQTQRQSTLGSVPLPQRHLSWNQSLASSQTQQQSISRARPYPLLPFTMIRLAFMFHLPSKQW